MAIGLNLSGSFDIDIKVGHPADFVVFGNQSGREIGSFRCRKSIQGLVYDAGPGRTTIFNGEVVSSPDQG